MMVLKKQVENLEAKHFGVQNQIFEMESKLLKCLSDNKQYVVRKIRELSQAIKINATQATLPQLPIGKYDI